MASQVTEGVPLPTWVSFYSFKTKKKVFMVLSPSWNPNSVKAQKIRVYQFWLNWSRNLPVMVKSSKPQETKWEKCKSKRWEGPTGQGIADPFSDLTEEIGSRNILKQATCMRRMKSPSSELDHGHSQTPLLYSKTHKGSYDKCGAGDFLMVIAVWSNPLGEKGKHSDNSLLPSELPGILWPTAWWAQANL